jgi:cytochrome P450
MRCAQLGDDIVVLRLGLRRLLLVLAPDLIEFVLLNSDGAFRKSRPTEQLHSLLGDGMLSSSGSRWREQRRLTQPFFRRASLEAGIGEMEEMTHRRTARWQEGVLAVDRDLFALSLTIAARTMFGIDLAARVDEVLDAFDVVLARVQRASDGQILWPMIVPTRSNRAVQAAHRMLDALVLDIVGSASVARGRADLLTALLRREDPSERHRSRVLRDEIVTMLLASHVTTGAMLTWSLHLLARHPVAQEVLARELKDHLQERSVASVDLRSFRYLNAVMYETLRLFPPVWALQRRCRTDVKLGDQKLVPGTDVLVSQWVTHRDPRYFAEPERFLPERWLDGLERRLPAFAYFPFGGGPRRCIGQTLALLEAGVVLATILRRWIVSPAELSPVVPYPYQTSVRPRDGLRLTLSARTPNPSSQQAATLPP